MAYFSYAFLLDDTKDAEAQPHHLARLRLVNSAGKRGKAGPASAAE